MHVIHEDDLDTIRENFSPEQFDQDVGILWQTILSYSRDMNNSGGILDELTESDYGYFCQHVLDHADPFQYEMERTDVPQDDNSDEPETSDIDDDQDD